MGNEVYIGWYFRIYPQTKEREIKTSICSGCLSAMLAVHNYCPACGQKRITVVKKVEYKENALLSLERIFGKNCHDIVIMSYFKYDGSLYIAVDNRNKKSNCVLSVRYNDMRGEFGELPSKEMDRYHQDICQKLDEHGISYDKIFGIFNNHIVEED